MRPYSFRECERTRSHLALETYVNALGNGLGDDVAGINHERLAAVVARALACGGITPQPDDNSDGDGTGHPVPKLGPGR